MQRNRAIIWGIFLATLVVSLLALFVPVPASWESSTANFNQRLVINIIMAFLHIGGAILFITNLDVYTSRLRRAYIIMASGTIVVGAGTLQILLLILFDVWQTPYGRSGITMVPFLLSGVLLYLGIRSFAKIIGAKHTLARAWIVFPASLSLAILAALLPYMPGPIPEVTSRLLMGVDVWSGSLIFFTALLVQAIKRSAGSHYGHAMTWLGRALFVSSSVLVYQGLYGYINTGEVWYFDLISNILIILSGCTWIRAGYAFALTKYYSQDIPLRRFLVTASVQKPVDQSETIIDMVTSTASLASNSADIDPLLDSVRTITSQLKPGQDPSARDSQSLISTYLKLEQYLLSREPIRVYTKQELRARLNPSLQKMIIAEETKRN